MGFVVCAGAIALTAIAAPLGGGGGAAGRAPQIPDEILSLANVKQVRVEFENLPADLQKAGMTSERFQTPNPLTEYGFLVLQLDSRAVPGMGKRTLDQIYLKLGQVEMDDMAEGVKALWNRPYFDRTRVGIHGSSYGGYSSAMEILRHPEVFAAASAASPPTDWRNYDSIYTERYMWVPEENKDGYDSGAAMTYANNLKGRLLIYYGTADNNVHPSNSMQLIKALQQAGKSFEVQVGPDQGHSNVNPQRMMEFFIENLVIHPAAVASTGTAPAGR